MKKKSAFRTILYSFLPLMFLSACGPLNPINDFFGIQMNPDEEANFIIVDYSDIDGITYNNSINMNPKINAWAEFGGNEITLKVVNNSGEPISLNYTADQFILVTPEKEYFLGKGERENYFKKGVFADNSSENFILEYPTSINNISKSGGNYADQRLLTKDVLRNYSKTEGRLAVVKDDITYFIVKLGNISIVLKKVPKK